MAKKHKISSKIKLMTLVVFAFVSVVTATGFYAGTVRAGCVTTSYGTTCSGGGSGAGGGRCGNSSDHWWVDTCYGAVWVKGTADSDHIAFPGSPGGNIKTSYVDGCKSNGGAYYALTYQAYNPSTQMPIVGDYRGLVQVRDISKWLGLGEGTKYSDAGTTFKYFAGVTENWDDVYSAWDSAQKKGLAFDTAWLDTSYFCYDPNNLRSTFSATSTIKVDAQTGLGSTIDQTSDPDGETKASVQTTAAETKVQFWHNLKYNGEAVFPDGASTPEVSSYWTVRDHDWNDVGAGRLIADQSYRTNARGANATGHLGEETVTVSLQPGESKTVCHNISYRSKTYDFLPQQNQTGYDGDPKGDVGKSQGCVTVTRVSGDNPDDCEYTGTCPKGDAWFQSTSTVSIGDIPRKDGGKDVEAMSDTSDPDGTSGDVESEESMDAAIANNNHAGWIAFSVDYETTSVDVNFVHNITYTNSFNFESDDTVPAASTYWNVYSDIGSGSSGTFTVNSSKVSQPSGDLYANTVNVPLPNEGDKVTVCQTIQYDPKYISFRVLADHDGRLGHRLSHQYYEYGLSGHGTGRSKACAQVTRRKRPQGVPYSTGGSGEATGAPNTTVMYAGEKASSIGWNNLTASGSMSNRLTAFQSIVYLVAPDKNMDSSNPLTKGGRIYDSSMSPCNYYNGKTGYEWCQVVSNSPSGGMSISSGRHAADIAIAVPDLVGYKYCNSAGWFWEGYVWRCHGSGKDRTCGWERNPSGDHWFIYDSACRTIAKKPSVAFWNSGLYASGSIKSSSSPRYTIQNNLNTRNMVTANGAETLYGSWSEHLSVAAYGPISGFASGSAISLGNANKNIAENYSTLSIANSDKNNIGNSQIGPNPSLRTRLNTYLSQPLGSSISSFSSIPSNSDKTQVFVANGTLNIDHNIEVNGQYNNIYQIPKTVIFVNGNVNIKPGVTRIDAWIIATGTINTCQTDTSSDTAQFRAGSFNNGNRGTTTITHIGNVGTGAEAPVCEDQLVFNGAVIAGGVNLKRTYGSDPESSQPTARYTPAEIFDLSADNYFWAYAQAGRYNSSYTEAYSRELAPRY